MQNVFNVTSIIGNYSDKTICIETNFVVDETTVNKKTIKISEASSGTIVIYKLSTNKNRILVTLKEFPSTNTFYQVSVSDIKDKLGRELTSAVTKDLKFKVDTLLKAIITSPNNNEAVIRQHNLVYFSIKQINSDGTVTDKPGPTPLLNISLPTYDSEVTLESSSIEAILGDESDVKYHFEFASDIAFFNVIKDYVSDTTDGLLELDNGQYFMRAMIIENEMKSDWSDIITFTVIPDTNDCSNTILNEAKQEYIDNILNPIEFFLEDNTIELLIESKSDNGETFPEFYIEFNKELDESTFPKTITAYRSDL